MPKKFPEFAEVAARANGHWSEILPALGVDAELINRGPKHHGPCPGCAGKDRFRYDDLEGRGTWFCNGGGNPQSGDGFDLLCHVHGWTKLQVLQEVARHLGVQGAEPIHEEVRKRSQDKRRQDAKKRKETEAQAKTAAREKSAEDFATAAAPDPNHPYLTRKNVGAYGEIKQFNERLLVPAHMLTEYGREFVGYQWINGKGTKRNAVGTTLDNGGMFVIEGDDTRCSLAEGYSTAATIHEATNATVFVSFGAANMRNVARSLRKHRPALKVYPAADNDADKNSERRR